MKLYRYVKRLTYYTNNAEINFQYTLKEVINLFLLILIKTDVLSQYNPRL
jgi:hypothetical protein